MDNDEETSNQMMEESDEETSEESDEETSNQMMEESDANGGENLQRPVKKRKKSYIEKYADRYTGRTKIVRLLFIADRCDNRQMKLDALRMAFDEIKKGNDAQLFREVVQKIDGALGPSYAMDSRWLQDVKRRAEQRMDELENELISYRTNLIKESIRMVYNDFGDFFYSHGMLGDAFQYYVWTGDYCTALKHFRDMCLNAILVSIEMGQFTHVTSYVSKAEHRPEALDPVTIAKLLCAGGLAHLELKEYKLAACKFLEVGDDLRSTYTDVIARQDVATYGVLCALATFDRAELKTKVISNYSFRNFLMLIPEVRDLINDFYSCRYASCLENLRNLKAKLLWDIHLHDHVETLYTEIRNKALIQYTHPFVSVDLHKMANAFRTDVSALEKELAALITNNKIQARIDSHNKVLYARHADQRNATFQRVLQTGSQFDRDVRDIIKYEFNQKQSRKGI